MTQDGLSDSELTNVKVRGCASINMLCHVQRGDKLMHAGIFKAKMGVVELRIMQS